MSASRVDANMTPESGQDLFRHIARGVSDALGRPAAFWLAAAMIAVWASTGPVFHFSNTWQLVINTGTTIITFLMVFIIQNTQNRDNKSIHLKLDELIKAMHGARNSMIDLDRLSDQQLHELEVQYKKLCDGETAAADPGPAVVKHARSTTGTNSA
jgi:low affinity Fe/Cu permease